MSLSLPFVTSIGYFAIVCGTLQKLNGGYPHTHTHTHTHTHADSTLIS